MRVWTGPRDVPPPFLAGALSIVLGGCPAPQPTPDAGPAAGNCTNGVDDDRDGTIDCLDPQCVRFADCPGSEVCANGIDDKGTCLAQPDGKPCLDSAMCEHGLCFTEAGNGHPNGTCTSSDAIPCTWDGDCSPAAADGGRGGHAAWTWGRRPSPSPSGRRGPCR